MTQLAMTLEGPMTRQTGLKAPKPLEAPTNAPQARTDAGAKCLCPKCGQGPVRPGQRCGWCGKRVKGEG